MGIAGSIVVFLVIWWTVLFAILPMRVKGVWEDEGRHAKGVDQGAPVDPMLWFKLKRTTWVALIIFAVVFVVINSGVISYER
jgi:predicted secreted protein